MDAVTTTDAPTTTSSRLRTAFRAVALAEAVSWACLLVTMVLKWVVQDDPHAGLEGGVPIAGPIHGALFVAYLVMCLLARRAFDWSTRTTLIALAASVPPFLTAVFESMADRRGLLTPQGPERRSTA